MIWSMPRIGVLNHVRRLHRDARFIKSGIREVNVDTRSHVGTWVLRVSL